MINNFAIIAPYTDQLKFKTGDTFSFKGKSTLITGSNNIGKSTLLHTIFQSFNWHHNLRFQGEVHSRIAPNLQLDIKEYADYDDFGEDYNYLKETYTKDLFQQFKSSNPRSLGMDLDAGFISKAMLNYYIEKKEFAITSEVFKSQSDSMESFVRNTLQYEDGLGEGFHSKLYTELLVDYAKENNLPVNQFLGAVALIDNGYGLIYNNDFSNWLLGKPTLSKKPKTIMGFYNIPQQNEIFLGKIEKENYSRVDENVSSEESLGTVQKQRLDYIINEEGSKIVLLDEPFNSLDEKSTEEYENKILESKDQYIVVNHDRFFKKQAEENNWNIIDLDNYFKGR